MFTQRWKKIKNKTKQNRWKISQEFLFAFRKYVFNSWSRKWCQKITDFQHVFSNVWVLLRFGQRDSGKKFRITYLYTRYQSIFLCKLDMKPHILLLSFTNKSLKCQIPTIAIHLGWKILTTWVFSHSKTSFVLQLLAEAKHNLDTIQDFLCKLDMEPHMHLKVS